MRYSRLWSSPRRVQPLIPGDAHDVDQDDDDDESTADLLLDSLESLIDPMLDTDTIQNATVSASDSSVNPRVDDLPVEPDKVKNGTTKKNPNAASGDSHSKNATRSKHPPETHHEPQGPEPLPAAATTAIATRVPVTIPPETTHVPATPRASPTLPPSHAAATAGEDVSPTHVDDDDGFDKDYYQNNGRPPVATTIASLWNGVLAALAGLCAMIVTAWQMSDNPDGLFASLCRLVLTGLQYIYRLVSSPCRKCGCLAPAGVGVSNGYHEPYGHMRVSTMEYGFSHKDPTTTTTLELA